MVSARVVLLVRPAAPTDFHVLPVRQGLNVAGLEPASPFRPVGLRLVPAVAATRLEHAGQVRRPMHADQEAFLVPVVR